MPSAQGDVYATACVLVPSAPSPRPCAAYTSFAASLAQAGGWYLRGLRSDFRHLARLEPVCLSIHFPSSASLDRSGSVLTFFSGYLFFVFFYNFIWIQFSNSQEKMIRMLHRTPVITTPASLF